MGIFCPHFVGTSIAAALELWHLALERTPMKTPDFKAYLQQELIARIKKNPRYSLRAFAAQLEMDPSTLSKILKGKRPLGKKTTLLLASRLGLSTAKASRFLGNGEESPVIPHYRELALDHFAVISDWHHFAIMELMAVRNFSPSPAWIAKALGIKTVEATAAIERLQRVGMLEIAPDGSWIDRSSGFTTNIGSNMSSSAHRKLQEQLLAKAQEALRTVDIEDRDHTAMTMAIDRSRLPEAREKIAKFRRSLTQFLTETTEKSAVYNLNVALFPLTNSQGVKNEKN